jgi:hypothetical protein
VVPVVRFGPPDPPDTRLQRPEHPGLIQQPEVDQPPAVAGRPEQLEPELPALVGHFVAVPLELG